MKTIVLDPGHGGVDPGAVNGSRLEKNDNLNLTLAVQKRLLALGQRVVMTRFTDVAVSLAERSAISNRHNTDVFVSIHRNAFTSPAANGVENFVYINPSQTETRYAQHVLDEVVRVGVQSNRGLKRGNFAVLRNTHAPAMLLEMGFISNARDNQLFDQHLGAYADAIVRGLAQSLGFANSPAPGSSFNYTVVSGDTLWQLAQRFGVSVDAIMAQNGLTNSNLSIGQVLRVPAAASAPIVNYTVVAGDTLWRISQQFGVSVEAIMAQNGLTNSHLSIGQVLRIPVAAPPSLISYTVVSGDTLWRISQQFGVSIDAIMAQNGLTNSHLSIGQVLKIPR